MLVDCVWNVMAHAQKPNFIFQWNGWVHLNRQGHQFSRLLAAGLCASAVVMVVMLDTPCFEVVWRVLATHSIHQFPHHFPSRASLCVITFQLDSIYAQDCKMSQSWKLNVLNCVVGYTLFLVMCYRGWWRWTTTVCSSSGCADVPSSTQVSSGMSYSLSAPSDSRRYGSEAEYLITWFSK